MGPRGKEKENNKETTKIARIRLPHIYIALRALVPLQSLGY